MSREEDGQREPQGAQRQVAMKVREHGNVLVTWGASTCGGDDSWGQTQGFLLGYRSPPQQVIFQELVDPGLGTKSLCFCLGPVLPPGAQSGMRHDSQSTVLLNRTGTEQHGTV